MLKKDWTTYKGLWLLSIPSILASMLEPLSAIVDTALVGNFDSDMLAAMAIGVSIMSSLTWMFNFLVHAPIQAISNKIGSGDKDGIISLIKITFLLALVIGLVLTLTVDPLRDKIYMFLSVDTSLYKLCDEYFMTRLHGHVFVLLYMTGLAILRGMAKVNVVLIVIGLTTLTNIVLSYLGLYKLDYGLASVAAATVAANALGFMITLVLILRSHIVKGEFFKSKMRKKDFKHIGKSSLGVFVRSAFLTLSFFLSTKIASSISIKTLAAHQIILNFWLFASFFTDGIATSGNIIGGTLYKNEGHSKLRGIYNKLLVMGGGVGVFFWLVFTFFHTGIVSVFTYDKEIASIVNSVMYFIAVAQVPVAIAYVYDGLVFGINRFDYLSKCMVAAFFLCFLPIAYLSYEKQSFLLLWVAMTAIGVFRLITNAYIIGKEVKTHV